MMVMASWTGQSDKCRWPVGTLGSSYAVFGCRCAFYLFQVVMKQTMNMSRSHVLLPESDDTVT